MPCSGRGPRSSVSSGCRALEEVLGHQCLLDAVLGCCFPVRSKTEFLIKIIDNLLSYPRGYLQAWHLLYHNSITSARIYYCHYYYYFLLIIQSITVKTYYYLLDGSKELTRYPSDIPELNHQTRHFAHLLYYILPNLVHFLYAAAAEAVVAVVHLLNDGVRQADPACLHLAEPSHNVSVEVLIVV